MTENVESTAAETDAEDQSRCCSCCSTRFRCCRPVISVMRSSVCLGIVFFAYAVAGAFLFQFVELQRDLRHTDSMEFVDTTSSLCNITSGNDTDPRRHLQVRVKQSTGGEGWTDVAGTDTPGQSWTFPGSFLYSVSLITTVGYGNQIPRTKLGRLVSIPYLVIGTPLTFCFLSRAGRDLARLFRSVYHNVCCDLLCCKRCLRRRRRRIYSTGDAFVYQRSPDGASCVATNSSVVGDRLYRGSHVYESIGDTEGTWRKQRGYMSVDDPQRHLAESNCNSLTRHHMSLQDPDRHTQAGGSLTRRTDTAKSALKGTTDTMDRSTKLAPKSDNRSGQTTEPPASHVQQKLMETVSRVNAAYQPETYDSIGREDATKRADANLYCETSDKSRVIAPQRRSRQSTTASRRSSVVGVGRRHGTGRIASARPRLPMTATWDRALPVGAAATPQAVELESTADPFGCLGARSGAQDSDEESYVTACNSTPLLLRAFSIGDAARNGRQHRRAARNSTRTGTGNTYRRRRRLKASSSYVAEDSVVGQPATLDHPEASVQASTYAVTTRRPVPVVVCVVLLCLYVLTGATLFRQLYGAEDWSHATFISLAAITTVGGWYVDHGGHSGPVSWWPPDPRIVYAVWLIGGLAVLSACVQLILHRLSTNFCCRCSRSNT